MDPCLAVAIAPDIFHGGMHVHGVLAIRNRCSIRVTRLKRHASVFVCVATQAVVVISAEIRGSAKLQTCVEVREGV